MTRAIDEGGTEVREPTRQTARPVTHQARHTRRSKAKPSPRSLVLFFLNVSKLRVNRSEPAERRAAELFESLLILFLGVACEERPATAKQRQATEVDGACTLYFFKPCLFSRTPRGGGMTLPIKGGEQLY